LTLGAVPKWGPPHHRTRSAAAGGKVLTWDSNPMGRLSPTPVNRLGAGHRSLRERVMQFST